MNEIQVTLRGNVATEPRLVRFDDGNTLASFRLASTVRRFDRARQEWVDRGTTFVDVTCRRAMAANAAMSVRKGQPMVVTGRLSERFWSANGRSGSTLEIQADGLGHDLSFGTSQFARVVRAERRSPTDVSGYPVLPDTDDGADTDDELDPSARTGGYEVISGPKVVGGPEMAGRTEMVDGTEQMDEGDEGDESAVSTAEPEAANRRLDLTSTG